MQKTDTPKIKPAGHPLPNNTVYSHRGHENIPIELEFNAVTVGRVYFEKVIQSCTVSLSEMRYAPLGFDNNLENKITIVVNRSTRQLKGPFCVIKAFEAMCDHVVEAG